MIYTFSITFNTHDGLKEKIEDGSQFVAVQATNETEASLIATQMIGCRGYMPTGSYLLEVT